MSEFQDSFLQSLVSKMIIKCVLLAPEAKLPYRATIGSAGSDLFSAESCEIESGTRRLISIGIALQIPEHTYGRIAPRSGLALHHSLDICAGVIDSDYTGEIKVLAANNGKKPYHVNIGDRIAQIIFEKIETANFVTVSALDETKRSSKGFGSSG